MKKIFFDTMLGIMRDNPDVYLLFGGLGWPRVDEFLAEFPDRAFNFEASEQTMLDACVGLAYANKIPVCYSITPFILYRPFETIRTYINKEKLNVKLIGAGRNEDYSKDDGFSHYAGDDKQFMEQFPNIKSHWPDNETQLEVLLQKMIKDKSAYYINLRR